MTTIVVSSLFLCVIFSIVSFVFAWCGIDVSSILSSVLTLFGTELGVCGIMTIFNRHNEAKDRRVEEYRKLREERKKERIDGNGENMETLG